MERAEKRGKREAAMREAHRIMMLPDETRITVLEQQRDPAELYALYKYGPPDFTVWCDAKNDAGDNVWSYLLRTHHNLPRAESRKVENQRWLYFAYCMPFEDTKMKMYYFERPGNGDFDAVSVFWNANQSFQVMIESQHAALYQPQNRHVIAALTRELGTLVVSHMVDCSLNSQITIGSQSIECLHGATVYSAALRTRTTSIGIQLLYIMFKNGFAARFKRKSTRGTLLIQCAACGAPSDSIDRRCGGCERVGYCSEKCAEHHWKQGGHHLECKP